MSNLTSFTAYVVIKVKRISCKRWESYALVQEHRPRRNRLGRILASYSPGQALSRVDGTEQYKSVTTEAEARQLAISHAREYIRDTRAAHNAYCRQLVNQRAETEEYIRSLAVALWPKRGMKEHLLRNDVDAILSAAGRNERDEKHDPETALNSWNATYRVQQEWKALAGALDSLPTLNA